MTADLRAGHDDTRGEWQAYHIFYSGGPHTVLLDCAGPLIDDLAADGLLAGHFYINYWLEGPHVRLRLRPSSPWHSAEVQARAEAAITLFLRRRPSLFEVPPGYLDEYYDQVFRLEFSEDQRERLLGPDGTMRLRANNTFSVEPYEPEYGKYGGPAGVELAEWHFQHSSDLAIEAMGTRNLHLRTVALGFSAQLMTVTAGCLLGTGEALAGFFEGYHAYWSGAAATVRQDAALDDFDKAYTATRGGLTKSFGPILAALDQDDFTPLPAVLRAWAQHCRQLRERILDLASRGDLVFEIGGGAEEPAGVVPVLARLLASYLHMTNNRLSMTMRDEAYLAYLLARVLNEFQAVRP